VREVLCVSESPETGAVHDPLRFEATHQSPSHEENCLDDSGKSDSEVDNNNDATSHGHDQGTGTTTDDAEVVALVDGWCAPMTPPPLHISPPPPPPPTDIGVDMGVQCQLIGSPLPASWGAASPSHYVINDDDPKTPADRRLPSVTSPDTAPTPARRPTVGSEVVERTLSDEPHPPSQCDMPPPPEPTRSSAGSPLSLITRQSTSAFPNPTGVPSFQGSVDQQQGPPLSSSAAPIGGYLSENFDFGSSQQQSQCSEAVYRRGVSSIADGSSVSHVSASHSPAKGGGAPPLPPSEGGSSRRRDQEESPFCQRQLVFSSTAGTSTGASSGSQASPGLDTQIANALDALGGEAGAAALSGISPPKAFNRVDLFDSQLSRHSDATNDSPNTHHAIGPPRTTAATAAPAWGAHDLFEQCAAAVADRQTKSHSTRLLDSQHVVFDDEEW
jgi:hypothetical protein